MAYHLINSTVRQILRNNLAKPFKNSIQVQNNIRSASTTSEQPHMLSMKRIRKNYELIPLVAIMVGAVGGLGGYIVYSSRTRSDVVFRKHGKPLSETMDLLNPQRTKMITFNQEYRPLTEVNEIYKSMENSAAEITTKK